MNSLRAQIGDGHEKLQGFVDLNPRLWMLSGGVVAIMSGTVLVLYIVAFVLGALSWIDVVLMTPIFGTGIFIYTIGKDSMKRQGF